MFKSIFGLLLIFSIFCFIQKTSAFSECPNSGVSDPGVSGVTDCLSWVAYIQATGSTIQSFCSNSSIFQKCCLTCQKYSTASSITCSTVIGTCGGGSCVPVTFVVNNAITVSTIGCICPTGTGGQYCQRQNYCNLAPCLNNGTCNTLNDEDLQYSCSCPASCTGKTCNNCTTTSSPCSSLTCLNSGVCTVSNTNQAYCVCPNGYSGPLCQFNSNACASNPCLNNATCSTNGTSYNCQCQPNFFGSRCQVTVAPCVSNPCLNNGTCLTGITGGYYCTCPSNYYGTNCQTVANTPCLNPNPCLNGATCFPYGSSYQCSCSSGYFGTNCQNYNYCYNSPCQNGGICFLSGTNGLSGLVCICPAFYTGSNCQLYTNPCNNSPCFNGGTCQSLGISYSCVCTNNYTGANCQTLLYG